MKRMFIWAAGFIFGIIGCQEQDLPLPVVEKEVKESWVVRYEIEQGEHASYMGYQPLEGISTVAFTARFDSSAIYKSRQPENQQDINKLWGFADCDSHHHSNSARFGWRWYQNQLQIWAYCYSGGERSSKFIGTVSLGQYHKYSIQQEGESYIFRLDNKEVKMSRGCSGTVTGHKLYPYFGGDEPAPHDITIWIDEQ